MSNNGLLRIPTAIEADEEACVQGVGQSFTAACCWFAADDVASSWSILPSIAITERNSETYVYH